MMKSRIEYVWVHVTDDAAFPGRDGAGALVYKDRMWLIGGWNPRDKVTNPIHSNCNNEVWSSSDGKAWNRVKPNTHLDNTFDPASDWEARHTAGYVVFQDKMWIVGGDPLLGHYQFDVWNSEDGKTWRWVNPGDPVPWGPRVLHYTVAFKGRIWVMGGQTLPQFAAEEERFYADIWNTTDGIHWNKVESKGPSWSHRGMIGGSVVLNDRIWLLGGGVYQTPSMTNYQSLGEVWSTPDGSHWECHTKSTPWSPRVYHDTGAFDGKLWIMEGAAQASPAARPKNSNDVWCSSDGVEWHEVPDTPWSPRHAASLFVFQDALWMIAGNHMGRDVWKLVRKR
ncbi:MAG: hypothetical protein HYU36_16200 [Planctomycetes bacterium]|nr:hypothetical protein [Planctomycetota bacterium]